MPMENTRCEICGITGNGRQIRPHGGVIRCRATQPEHILHPENCRRRRENADAPVFPEHPEPLLRNRRIRDNRLPRPLRPPRPPRPLRSISNLADVERDELFNIMTLEELEGVLDEESSTDEEMPDLIPLESNTESNTESNLEPNLDQLINDIEHSPLFFQNSREALITNPDISERSEMVQLINTVLMGRLVELTTENSRLLSESGPDNNVKEGLKSALEKLEEEKDNMPEGCYLKICGVLQEVWRITS